jgi:hypothetical protein
VNFYKHYYFICTVCPKKRITLMYDWSLPQARWLASVTRACVRLSLLTPHLPSGQACRARNLTMTSPPPRTVRTSSPVSPPLWDSDNSSFKQLQSRLSLSGLRCGPGTGHIESFFAKKNKICFIGLVVVVVLGFD